MGRPVAAAGTREDCYASRRLLDPELPVFAIAHSLLRTATIVAFAAVFAGCGDAPSGGREAPGEREGAAPATLEDQHDFRSSLLPPSDAAVGQPTGEVTDTPEGPLRRAVFYTRTYEIDRLYPSMHGPSSAVTLSLSQSRPELVWIKGMYSEVVDAEGNPDISQEFMCHVVGAVGSEETGIDLNVVDTRFATLSQGQDYKQYPVGYGYPILATDPIRVESQVLNLRVEGEPFSVRHRVVVLFIVDREARVPMKPLRSDFAQVMVRVGENSEEGGVFGVLKPEGVAEGASCSPGRRADSIIGLLPDDLGRLYSPHFMVDPGRVEFRTLVTEQLNLKRDTRIHAIDVHIHPFCESLELRDLTTDEVLFRSQVEQIKDGVGVAHVETYRSSEGIPVYKDHHYAMVTVYDNPTDQAIDAMASFYIGLADPSIDVAALRTKAGTQGDRPRSGP